MSVVVIVVVVVVIIVVLVLLAMKTHKKKAVGGVKGKAVKTAAAKKTATKAVKVWCVCLKGVITFLGIGCLSSPDREVNLDEYVKRE